MSGWRAPIAAALLCGAAFVAAPTQATTTQESELSAAFPPLYAAEFELSRGFVDRMMAEGVVVPVPKDPGGGYTHEQHKSNYRAIYLAGDLYRLTGDTRYRDYVRDLLLAYAALYPTLGDHPARANQNTGRLFWQVLNDAVWLVYAVQGYEKVRAELTADQRRLIDDQLFRRAAHFLSVESVRTFDKIHNHATWATAGVGMTGYLLGDRDLVNRALLGSDKSGETGFLRQTELLFSPDGYYAEGPYYQRYALLPFMVFAGAIDRYEPARDIFGHRDGVLLKALRTTIQLSYAGYFFPFNDALKDKGLKTDELYEGIAVAYAKSRDPSLLSIAQWQGRTVLSAKGLLVAEDLAAGKARPFPFTSQLFRDGPAGEQGAIAILRSGDGMTGQALVAKNGSQGMGHGHFDKLSWQFYDNGNEIVTDYGAARFLNIEAKRGGRYLPENESWAKQTVAHNTLVVDERSHFGGDLDTAEARSPEQLAFVDQPGLKLSSAQIDDAYPGVAMTRTIALVDVEGLEHPVVFDIVRAESRSTHSYDLPLHYMGQIMRVGFDLESHTTSRPLLGEANGYQHVWVDAEGAPANSEQGFVTWLSGDRFYTSRWIPQSGSKTYLAESGANDPDFNLRREPMVMQRVEDTREVSFVGILESHGNFDGAAERTTRSDSQVTALEHVRADGADLVSLTARGGHQVTLAISHNRDPAARHSAQFNGRTLRWQGFAAVITAPESEQ